MIISILAAAGIPSYQRYVARGNRAAVKAFMNDVAQRQESFFADRKHYATTLAALGYNALNDNGDGTFGPGFSTTALPATALIDANGNLYVNPALNKTLYTVSLVNNPAVGGTSSTRTCANMTTSATTASYATSWAMTAVAPAATATAPSFQERYDPRCSILCLNSTGRQGSNFTATSNVTVSDGWQTCWRG